MNFAVLKETEPGETRVALVPEAAKQLLAKGHKVSVEAGAGRSAFIPDSAYEQAGCVLSASADAAMSAANCVLKVRAPSIGEAERLPGGAALVSYLWAARNPQLVLKLKDCKITSFGMDAIPRISRAQSMDALSSMATIAGYKAVLLAAAKLGKFMPMLTTAAGTIRPARSFIIGAGVAGLQAIATARRLGAVVEAFDTRPAVKEQVESLGAKFAAFADEEPNAAAEGKGGYAKEKSQAFLAKETEFLAAKIKAADFVVTTAQIPGKKAPMLITRAMVQAMAPGSVIIDFAAESGGNCECTRADETVVENDVTIMGPTNLPASLPLDASRMYARNVLSFLLQIVKDPSKGSDGLTLDWNDEIFRETCITMGGEIKWK